jgi:hypothetical protein
MPILWQTSEMVSPGSQRAFPKSDRRVNDLRVIHELLRYAVTATGDGGCATPTGSDFRTTRSNGSSPRSSSD